MNKYIGELYDGRWKVTKCENRTITLENIYNHEIMELTRGVFMRVRRNQTTISNIRTQRAYRTSGKSGNTPPKVIRQKAFRAKVRMEGKVD